MDSPLYPGELIIDDTNYLYHMSPRDPNAQGHHGLVPRDFSTHPVGCYAFAKPFDLPLIPESEWQARLDAQIAAKAQLSNIRDISGPGGVPIPSRDQDGKGYAISNDSEILVQSKGWVAWPDYNWTDPVATVNQQTHLMEFQVPTHRYVGQYDDEMFYSTNRRLDFAVTRDHRMYVRKWDERRRTLSDRYSFVRAGELGWYCGLLAAPSGQIGVELVELEVPGDRRYDGDDFLALVSLVCSDGWVTHRGSPQANWVSFCCFREDRYQMVAALAARVGFRPCPSRPQVFARYDAGALAGWFRENAYAFGESYKSPDKKVPELVKCASMRQIKHFLAFYGDQNHGKDVQPVFYSSSKRMIDDLQELHLRAGKRSTIEGRGPRRAVRADGRVIESKGSYVLCVSQTDRLCIDRKKHIETDRYKGIVQCPTVPNGTIVTRRNGSVLISGNCWAHSSTSAALIVNAVAGEPYADFSAYAVACIIKDYRDQGGWGAESLEWIAAHGLPTSVTWPQQSMSRSNDNPAMRAEAAKHKFTEWMDLAGSGPLVKQQIVTALLCGLPVVVDYNWWSHSVCAIDLVSLDPFRIRIWNSWGDSWSANGTGILEGSKAIPNGALAARVMTPAA